MSEDDKLAPNCASHTTAERLFLDDMSLWVEGYGIGLVASFGVVLNVIGIYATKQKASHMFDCLLLPVLCFDSSFLFCKLANSYNTLFNSSTNTYLTIYQNLVYPFSHVLMTCSILMTTALTHDRYCATIRPIQHRNLSFSVHDRHIRALKYFALVLITSLILNLPAFWEMETAKASSDGTDILTPSQFHRNPYYKGMYTVVTQSCILLILPFCFMVYFNYGIFKGTHNRPQSQMTTEMRCHNERKKINSRVLGTAMILFFSCHVLSAVLTLVEFAVLKDTIISSMIKSQCNLPMWIQVAEHINQFLLTIGSCTNVIIYLFWSHSCTNVNFHICNKFHWCPSNCCDGSDTNVVVTHVASNVQIGSNDIELHLRSDVAEIE